MQNVRPVLPNDKDRDTYLDGKLAGIIAGVALVARNHAKVRLGVGMPARLYRVAEGRRQTKTIIEKSVR